MSQHACETVEVQREKSTDNPTGVVIINKSDLTDADVLVSGKAAAEPVVSEPPTPPAVTTQATAPPQPWLRKPQ